MGFETSLVGQRPQIVAVAAAGIENLVPRRGAGNFRDGKGQGLRDTFVMQPPPPSHRCRRIAGLSRTTILRLQKIDVAAARDIESMAFRTDQVFRIHSLQFPVAIANCAEEHPSSVANPYGIELYRKTRISKES